jgi:putative SOS response-associated peptidase YedK
MPDTDRWFLRVEKGGWWKDSVCDRDEGRFSFRVRRPLGRLERSCDRRMVTHCTVITGDPKELVAQIHTRMPVILPEEDHAKWLGEVDDGDLKALLKPFPADQMRIWAINPRVNSPENNDPEIIVPIPGNISDWKLAGP